MVFQGDIEFVSEGIDDAGANAETCKRAGA